MRVCMGRSEENRVYLKTKKSTKFSQYVSRCKAKMQESLVSSEYFSCSSRCSWQKKTRISIFQISPRKESRESCRDAKWREKYINGNG